ncbi:probable basic-leucine zipper transcription factor Q [Littorina saxatilis]|uniref:probable basic-leucine zipper transcription factor Q n=1 Tax=Littorina saxatilis TaxID=31220 RepID=UPI0038B43979
MTSTRFGMIGVVLFVVALSELKAYQWDGGPEDKAKITACLGGRASFPWSIVTGHDGETILNLDWWFQAPDKKKTQIATYESKHFYATDDVRVGFLPNAGLSIRFARPRDSGNYSVQVEIQQANSSLNSSVSRTVTLFVSDRPPATQDGALYVTLSDAVRDDVTEDWTLQLNCGQFVDLGYPPVDVVWKTPSGEVRKSSYQDNDTFVLSLSSPVQGGNYSCHLSPFAPAARCLTATSPLKAPAHLYVDVRLLYLEARQRELEQANEYQENLLQHQAMQILQHNGIMANMVQVNKDQAMQISQQNGTIEDMVQVNKDQAMQISQLNGTIQDMVQVNKDQANLLQHQTMQISQQNGTIQDMVQGNKDQANLLQRQTMQISQQNGTMGEMKAELVEVMQANKDQANLLQHQTMQISQQNGTMGEMKAELVEVMQANKDQAMQISQQNGTIEDMVQVNKDQAMQISQLNGTIQDMVQVNKDQANLLQHQTMQISQQNGTIQEHTGDTVTVPLRFVSGALTLCIWCK